MNAPERITFQKIGRSILQVLNLERGLFYTILVLLTKPGVAIETYLKRDRTKLLEPVRFLLIILAITTLVFLNYVGQDAFAGIQDALDEREKGKFIVTILEKYTNLLLVFIMPLMACFSIEFFKKAAYNGAEHLVINAYIFSFQSLIFIFITLLSSIISGYGEYMVSIIQFSSIFLLSSFYQIWVYYRIFKEVLITIIFKSIAVILLAIFFYFTLFFIFMFLLMGLG